MTIVTPRGRFMVSVQRKAMSIRSNGHGIALTGTRGTNEEMDNNDRLRKIIKEWRLVHPTHCPSVAQLCKIPTTWTMAEPSRQRLPVSYSRVTARLPATWQDFLVAAWVLLCVCLFCSLLCLFACPFSSRFEIRKGILSFRSFSFAQGGRAPRH